MWVAPFYEDGIERVAALLGDERVLMGSDRPHPEGLATPAAFAADLASLPAGRRRMILRDNPRAFVAQ